MGLNLLCIEQKASQSVFVYKENKYQSMQQRDLINCWDSQIPRRFRNAVFHVAGLKPVISECMSRVPFFGTSFSVYGGEGICILPML